MPRSRHTVPLSAAAAAAAATLVLAGCSGGGATAGDQPAAAPSSTATEGAFPVTVETCDTEITLDAAPERVLVLDTAAVSLLDAADALDRVVARVGEVPDVYFGDDVDAAVDAVPVLASETGPTGGVVISLETVIAEEPDLVIGYETETLTREALADAGIPLYVIPTYCDSPPPVGFDSIYAEVERYGAMFGTGTQADAAVEELRSQVEDRSSEPVVPEGTTAAALYLAAEGGTVYAYTALGMVTPQMEALGMSNVFADLPDRVPEISTEALVDADPDVVLVLDSTADAPAAADASLLAGVPGADALTAVQQERVYRVPFNYSEPPTPLVVDGLDVVAGLVGS